MTTTEAAARQAARANLQQELIAALTALLDQFDKPGVIWPQIQAISAARSVLAKARGEQA
ncbi:hypothetical protein [Cupriavidus sp. a3]|uniref:hypothetical protein n=1 Tax=Cupriavidus sp. a3 TaxID=3242158 RepID=UPI003D9C4FE7